MNEANRSALDAAQWVLMTAQRARRRVLGDDDIADLRHMEKAFWAHVDELTDLAECFRTVATALKEILNDCEVKQ